MGMYSDLFLAARDEASKLLDSKDPFHEWPSLSVKGVIEFEWIALGKIFKAEIFGKTLASKTEGQDGEDGGQVVRAMETTIVAKLAGLDKAGQSTLATKWQREAEGLAEWTPEEAEAMVHDLCQFAARAVKSGSSLLYSVVW